MKKLKFYILSEFGEILDIALYLKNLGYEVCFDVSNPEYSKIGEGMVEKTNDWWNYLGQDYIFIIDGCARGDMQDFLRGIGESVFGSSKAGDELENDRQKGQAWFKAAGFDQPESHNFKSIDEAIAFIEQNKDRRWVLKQNGDAPKSLNHMGKFDGNEDMLYHLRELKLSWNETEMGKVDFDLMEIVEGLEVAASAFFNGEDYMRNSEGKVIGYLNWEHKKEIDGDLGETTGEMGTLFAGVTEDNELFKDIMMRPEILRVLKKTGFRGVFDINGSLTEDRGYVAFEPTCRPGIPASSYEFIEGLKSDLGEMISAVAKGENTPVEIHEGVGMVMVVAAKPFPLEADVADEATSIGERLWVLKNKKPVNNFSKDQKEHIHLENFWRKKDDETGETYYKVATKNGYLLTVTGRDGKTIEKVRENLIQYIKDNLYISGMKFRSDIGSRVENHFK